MIASFDEIGRGRFTECDSDSNCGWYQNHDEGERMLQDFHGELSFKIGELIVDV